MDATQPNEVQERFADESKIYKARVVYLAMGSEASITLYTQAGGFELACATSNATPWMRDRHGRIVAIAEVPGVWVG